MINDCPYKVPWWNMWLYNFIINFMHGATLSQGSNAHTEEDPGLQPAAWCLGRHSASTRGISQALQPSTPPSPAILPTLPRDVCHTDSTQTPSPFMWQGRVGGDLRVLVAGCLCPEHWRGCMGSLAHRTQLVRLPHPQNAYTCLTLPVLSQCSRTQSCVWNTVILIHLPCKDILSLSILCLSSRAIVYPGGWCLQSNSFAGCHIWGCSPCSPLTKDWRANWSCASWIMPCRLTLSREV